MPLEWSSEFLIDNDEINNQHRCFVDLINRIENEYRNATCDEHKQKLIDELKAYAHYHFVSEMNIAFSLKLKGYIRQQERHTELMMQLNAKSDSLMANDISIDDFYNFLHEWFAGHTYHEDKVFFSGKLIEHLRKF